MSQTRKLRLLRALLFLHLFLFVWAVVFWGAGYVSLAHHRHEGVVYELIELFDPDYWPHRGSTMVPRWVRSVSIPGNRDDGDWSVRILWRGTLEQNLERLSQTRKYSAEHPAGRLMVTDLFANLSWVEGVRRSGNPEPTLIAYGTGKAMYDWWEERPGQVPRWGRDPFDVSLRIYNFNRFWLVWSRLTQTPPNVHVHTPGWGYGLSDWPVAFGREALPAADIFARLSLFQRGGVSPGFLLRALATPPRDIRHFISPLTQCELAPWLFPRLDGPWDMLYAFTMLGLLVPTVPYRYLFYLPLALVPRALAWPFAVLYALLLLGSWLGCAVWWWRLGRQNRWVLRDNGEGKQGCNPQ